MIDVYLFDKNKKPYAAIEPKELLEATEEKRLNGLITCRVEGIYSNKIESAYYVGFRDPDNGNVFSRFKVRKLTKKNGVFEIDGVHELFDDLRYRKIIKDSRPKNWPAVRALTELLNGTGWQVGTVHSDNKASDSWYYLSALDAFNSFLKKWQVEYSLRMVYQSNGEVLKYIDIFDQLSTDRGKWYEHGHYLLDVVASTSLDSVATAFIGRGKGQQTEGGGYGRKIEFTDVVWSTDKGDPINKPKGVNYIEFPEAAKQYGFDNENANRFKILEFSQIEKPEELIKATYKEALTWIRPRTQYRASILEQGLVELGETVTIVRKDLNIRYKTRVFKVTRNLLNTKIKSIEFGDQIKASVAQQLSAVANEVKEQQAVNESLVTTIINSIKKQYFGEDGYNYDLKADNEYDLPAGLYSFDKPIDENPSKVIYVGAGKLLIANSKTSDGKWDFKTIATGDGFVAEQMFANTILGDIAKFNYIDASMIHMEADKSLADDLAQIGLILNRISVIKEQVDHMLTDDVLTPLEQIDLQAKAEEVQKMGESALSRLDAYDSAEAKALMSAITALHDFLAQPIANYAAFNKETYDRLRTEFLDALLAVEKLARRNELKRYSDFESGQISLGNRIGRYEDQLVLEPNQITMNVTDASGGTRKAMTLGQEELAFYNNDSKVAYFANRQMFIETAKIKQQLQIGNHTMQKHGTDFTIFVYTGD